MEYEKLNPEVKPLILAKLRDEFVTQTQGGLRDKFGMCCLGVITECAIEAGLPIERRWNSEEGCYEYVYTNSNGFQTYESSVLPLPVADWAGLHEVDPIIGTDELDGPLRATSANDLKHMTLPQIADLFEENL